MGSLSEDENKYQLQVYDQNPQEDPSESIREGLSLGGVFAVRKPTGFGSGVAAGVSNFAKGVALGVTGFFVAPVSGYKDDGLKGAAKGLGLGTASVIGLPILGAGLGVYQVCAGGVVGVEGVQSKNKGKKFDPDQDQWVPKYRPLDEELAVTQIAYDRYQNMRQQKAKNRANSPPRRSGSKREVADDTYYKTLGVPTDATDAEIRKAYFKLARETHPDKNGNTPEANARFQAVGEAYQILCDPQLREKYDLHGKSDNLSTLDAGVFFTLIFGSEAFEPFVGKLSLTGLIEQSEQGDDIQFRPDKREQAYRVAKLACNLRDFLKGGVLARISGDDEAIDHWKAAIRAKAEELANQSFGSQLLDALGYSYESYAHYHREKKKPVNIAYLTYHSSKGYRSATNFSKAVRSAFEANRMAKKADKTRKHTKAQQSDSDLQTMPPEQVKAMEDSLEHMLESLLRICCIDVVDTGAEVSRKYLNDPSATKEEQKARQRCLEKTGQVFQEIAKKHMEAGRSNWRDQMGQQPPPHM